MSSAVRSAAPAVRRTITAAVGSTTARWRSATITTASTTTLRGAIIPIISAGRAVSRSRLLHGWRSKAAGPRSAEIADISAAIGALGIRLWLKMVVHNRRADAHRLRRRTL